MNKKARSVNNSGPVLRAGRVATARKLVLSKAGKAGQPNRVFCIPATFCALAKPLRTAARHF